MIIYEYANEKHLVDEFIKYTHHNKLSLGNQEVHLIIWAYEFWLPEGGKAGYNGSIDLIGTDELGNVWLIEAKQSANPELNPNLWMNQILNYRKALASRAPEEISLKSRRYLLRSGSSSLTVPSYIRENCNSLFEAFYDWGTFINKDYDTIKKIYNSTYEQIKNENVISTVLADVFRVGVFENRPSDEKPYAYIVINGIDALRKVKVIHSSYNFNPIDGESEEDQEQLKDWSEIIKEKQKVKPTPNSVEKYLSNKIVYFYEQCISNLEEVGWNGKYKSNSKAYIVDLPTIYGVPIRLHIGWVDFDGSIPLKNRIAGELGLKFNIDFRHFKHSHDEQIRNTGYELAKKLAKVARYNGRAAGLNIQYRDLTESEKNSWDWEMYRRIDKSNRDYLGNEDEKKDFEEVWKFLKEIVAR